MITEIKDISDQYISWINDPEINKYLEIRLMYMSIRNHTNQIQHSTRNLSNGYS